MGRGGGAINISTVMQKWASRQFNSKRGFTIVELLIVVVVIAILAAITIVAYNGITNKAKASAAASAAEQAAKKVAIYSVTNGDQVPPDLATAGITDQNGTSYQYSSNASSSPQTFCITATTNNISYFVNNTDQTTPKAGACPGHGVDGGGTITNLALQPIASNAWTGNFGSGGAGTRSAVADARFPGSTAYQLSWSTAPTGTASFYISENAAIPCVAGQQYFFSVRYAASWSGIVPNIWLAGVNVGVSANVTNRGDGTFEERATWTAPAGCTSFTPFLALATGSTLPTVGSTLRAGGFMVVAGQPSGANYADGNSPGWAWNGSPNSSTSTGPAL